MSDNLYDGRRRPVSWERSLYIPQLVFVQAEDNPTGHTCCTLCAMRIGNDQPGCAQHPCSGGAWFTEQEAAIMRLESS